MSENEPLILPVELLTVNELFGEKADSLREQLERSCPDLALDYGTNTAILGFVPPFFYNSKSPDFLDASTKAEITSLEIERYTKTVDQLASEHE